MNPAVQAMLKEGRKIYREIHGKTRNKKYLYLLGRATQCVRCAYLAGPDYDDYPDLDRLRTYLMAEIAEGGEGIEPQEERLDSCE